MKKLSSAIKMKKYRSNSWRVPGWFPLVDFDLVLAINKLQQELGFLGDILEIGTYKGKSGILLTLCAKPTETVRLLDLYADIRLAANPDSKDYKKLDETQTIKNLNKFGSKYELVFGNSLEIPMIIPKTPHRIIHIDGSHQYEIVRNDLQNALNLLSPDGVIILDDYSNLAYPGVALAFWEFHEDNHIEIVFATTSRVYFTHKQIVVSYQVILENLSHLRISEGFGTTEGVTFNKVTFKGSKRFIQKAHSLLSLFVLGVSRIL
jgi:hypothetical protein